MLLLVVLAGVVRRTGRRADDRVGTVMEALKTQMDEGAQELASAVARAEDESRRSRFLGEIAGSIDLDEVLAHARGRRRPGRGRRRRRPARSAGGGADWPRSAFRPRRRNARRWPDRPTDDPSAPSR